MNIFEAFEAVKKGKKVKYTKCYDGKPIFVKLVNGNIIISKNEKSFNRDSKIKFLENWEIVEEK